MAGTIKRCQKSARSAPATLPPHSSRTIRSSGLNWSFCSSAAARQQAAAGSVKYFVNNAGQPNPHIDPNDPNTPLVGCVANSKGDFDKDGHKDDVCYNFNLGSPVGNLLLQGGTIDLSGFTAQIGMRFYLP